MSNPSLTITTPELSDNTSYYQYEYTHENGDIERRILTQSYDNYWSTGSTDHVGGLVKADNFVSLIHKIARAYQDHEYEWVMQWATETQDNYPPSPNW